MYPNLYTRKCRGSKCLKTARSNPSSAGVCKCDLVTLSAAIFSATFSSVAKQSTRHCSLQREQWNATTTIQYVL